MLDELNQNCQIAITIYKYLHVQTNLCKADLHQGHHISYNLLHRIIFFACIYESYVKGSGNICHKHSENRKNPHNMETFMFNLQYMK